MAGQYQENWQQLFQSQWLVLNEIFSVETFYSWELICKYMNGSKVHLDE